MNVKLIKKKSKKEMKIKHFLLLPIVIGVLFGACSSTQQKEEISTKEVTTPTKKEIISTKAYNLLNKDTSIVVIDVRTPREFTLGHIKRAVNINIANQDFTKKIDALNPKDKTYLVYCRTHNRSNVAVKYMLENGFTDVYQMVDGFSGWAKNNLPY